MFAVQALLQTIQTEIKENLVEYEPTDYKSEFVHKVFRDKEKSGQELIYQVFIEPKGEHLVREDKWKEDFLLQIAEAERVFRIETDQYLLTAVPFYHYNNEKDFSDKLEKVLRM